jgi:transposase
VLSLKQDSKPDADDDIIGVPMGELGMPRQRIELALEEAEELSRRVRATTVSVRDRRRAEIILLSVQGLTQQRIAEQLGISRLAVNRWVGRFALHRLDGLNDRAGRGRKPWLPQAAVQQVVEQAVTPPPHLGRWSCRTMARAAGISPASVQRLWAASEIKPHLWRTFKLSNDKRFEEKFWDVIGLYLNPPEKALVLCCDEKSQCQALERTQPGLPLGIGHIRTKTHDYVRHGTVTLFAALNYLEGKLITRLSPRHRYQDGWTFSKPSMSRPRPISTSTSSPTITPPINIPRSRDGLIATPAFTCITRRPRHPG